MKFKLPGFLKHYQYLADTASKDKISYSENMYSLLEFEDEGREQRSKEMLLKIAGLEG